MVAGLKGALMALKESINDLLSHRRCSLEVDQPSTDTIGFLKDCFS